MHKSVFLAAGLMSSVLMCVGGCALPAIEGAKAAHVAMAGEYKEITPVAEGAIAKYKGYSVGELSSKVATIPEDTSEEDRAEAQERLDQELKIAQEVVALLPDRFNEYMVDDANLHLDAVPALVVSVRDIIVKKRQGLVGGLLPQVEVESTVTLTDAQTGEILGVATVYDHTSSRVLGSARQLANFICRGTASWINERSQLPTDK